ncbi:hypothetical protein Taro_045735 [Colocasia esculenta]|uniref:Secreted protein n=1 Tax=Colocasia esculenta TaxID=4460 RepID=A0A843WXR2_COLES|nr:hypothetical protein [Colocasia esculenta]
MAGVSCWFLGLVLHPHLEHVGCCCDALPHRDMVAVAVPFPVVMGRLALRTFRWGTRQVAWLRLVTEGDTFVAVSWRWCQEGCRLSPLPGTPILESLLREYSEIRACSSWQPSWQTLERRGKRGLDSGAESFVELSYLRQDIEVVEVFSSRRGPDSLLSHCLSLCWFRSHVVVLGVGPQLS